MNRILALLLALAMTLTLASCGAAAPGSDPAGSEESSVMEGDSSAEGEGEAALTWPDYQNSADYPAEENAVEYKGDDPWPEVAWKVACSGSDSDIDAQTIYYFNALMQQSTGGEVRVTVCPDDQLTGGDQLQAVQSLMAGETVTMSLHSNLVYGAIDPRFNVISLPYLLKNEEAADEILSGRGGDELKKAMTEHGVHCFAIGENGFHQITSSRKAVTCADDAVDGYVGIGSNELVSAFYESLDCSTSVMNWSEAYAALQQKTVWGSDNTIPAIAGAGLTEVQSYLTLWNAYYDGLFFCVSQSFYDQLTDEQKEVVDKNARQAIRYQKDLCRQVTQSIIDDWSASGAIQITPHKDIRNKTLKKRSAGVEKWYLDHLLLNGMTEDDAQKYIAAFKAE